VVGKKLLVEIDGNVADLPAIRKSKDTAGNAAIKKASPEMKKPKKTAKANLLPMVVIDAGHGGVDPGTIGPNNTQEKDVVLEYAKALKAKLLQTKRYRVLLTRSDDEFIMLRKRVEIARKAGASLFISLHADSAEEALARGLSVYTVSEKASDKEAAALAARENKSDIIGGMDLSDERPDVADILISLAQRETKNNSATFADLLVIKLGDKVRLLPNSHRFAGFAVLKAPDIPSVLIEVGFLSHPQEEKELKTKQYRDKVIDGIASGIDMFFRKKSSGMVDL
jgi:N-acetylmuramoyl-L-alanine amidase